MSHNWETLCEEIRKNPIPHRTIITRMPTDRDESSSIMRGVCDGIYPIREEFQMKKRNPTIVSVTARRTDPREADARNIVMWLKTVPTGAVHDSLMLNLTLANDWDCVKKLQHLANHNLDITIPVVTTDFLRVSSDKVKGNYSVTYMEYFPPDGPEPDHYSALCTQDFAHVVDVFRALQIRIESGQPSHPAKV